MLLNIALLALVARPGVEHVVLSLCMNGWVLYARLARAEVLALREREFVLAARALGATESRVLFVHLVPNLLGPLVVQATAGFGGVILMESTLSFLGLGPARSVSWGALLDQGSCRSLALPARGPDLGRRRWRSRCWLSTWRATPCAMCSTRARGAPHERMRSCSSGARSCDNHRRGCVWGSAALAL